MEYTNIAVVACGLIALFDIGVRIYKRKKNAKRDAELERCREELLDAKALADARADIIDELQRRLLVVAPPRPAPAPDQRRKPATINRRVR